MTDIVSTALDVEHGTEKTFVAQAVLDLVNLLSVSRAVQCVLHEKILRFAGSAGVLCVDLQQAGVAAAEEQGGAAHQRHQRGGHQGDTFPHCSRPNTAINGPRLVTFRCRS